MNPGEQATRYAESKRDRIQRSVVDQQLVDLVQEAFLAGYSAHIQDVNWPSERVPMNISNRYKFRKGDSVRLTPDAFEKLNASSPGVYDRATYVVIDPCTAAGYIEVVPTFVRRLLTEDEIVLEGN